MTDAAAWPATRARVLRTALSVGVATGAYGLSFGALGVAADLSVAQTCALSVLVFTGGSQFALVGVLGGGGSAVSGTASAVLLGARNVVYGARLAGLLRVRGLHRLVGAQLVIDESTAVALGAETTSERAGRLGFWATGLAVFALWNLATLVGARGRQRHRRPARPGPGRRGAGRLPRAAGTPAARPTHLADRAGGGPRRRRGGPGGPGRGAGAGRRPGAGGGRRGPAAVGMTWAAILATAAGCYLLKLAGLWVPEQVLDHPLMARVSDLLPVALLAALAAVQTVATGETLVLDARVAGVAVAAVALLLRAPFLVVVAAAAATAALLRLLG